MFEFVDETDFRIAELKAFFPGTSQECIDNLLRVLVFQREEQETCSCLLKGESTGQYFPCDLDMKIRLEISKWVEALQAALDRNYELLKKIGPALFAVCEQDYPYRAETIARTLRMFLLCEALILKERCSRNNPYKDSVKDLLALTQAEDIIQQVRGARTVLTGNCQLSLALALLIAIGESQCEHFQAFSWEAYSAGRARDALLRQWPQMSDVQAVIDLIAVLIRCQSAVGQAVRGSGSWQLIERFACHPEEDPANKVLAFTNKERIAALRLMSIVEEGRNHLVPILVGRVRVDGENVGASDAWNRDEFLDRARKYVLDFGSRHKLPVYSYMRAKHVLGPQHNCCEKTVTRLDGKIKALKDTISRRMGSEMKDYCTASFGQEQVKENLRSILQMVLEGFPDDEDRQDAYFKENFRVFGFQIPDDYSLNRKEGRERTLKVLLQDFLVAERLVFPGATSSTLLSANEGPKNDDESAARLFQHLLDRAKDIMGDSLSPECGHWREKRKKGSRRADDLAAYIPFPLVRRISEVVYLLRRDRCFSLPVVIDNRQQPRWIRIPADVKKDADHLQQIIANFLLGSVLNQAMAQGMEHVDLDLKTIALHNCGLAPELAEMPQTEGVMQPDDWRRIIQELYLHGGYSTLLGRYMRNYNTRFDVFRLLGGTDSSVPESRATTDTIDVGYGTFKALDLYLTNHSNMPMLLIGVDIGGTLTKIQVYQYDPQASCKMKPIGEASRMQTGDPDSSMLAEDNTNAGKALAIGTQRERAPEIRTGG